MRSTAKQSFELEVLKQVLLDIWGYSGDEPGRLRDAIAPCTSTYTLKGFLRVHPS
jgi:hypothetical protein